MLLPLPPTSIHSPQGGKVFQKLKSDHVTSFTFPGAALLIDYYKLFNVPPNTHADLNDCIIYPSFPLYLAATPSALMSFHFLKQAKFFPPSRFPYLSLLQMLSPFAFACLTLNHHLGLKDLFPEGPPLTPQFKLYSCYTFTAHLWFSLSTLIRAYNSFFTCNYFV